MFVVPDCYSGIEVLHGAMEILFCGGSDYVVMVCHEDDMVDEKVIFFMGFLECLEEYADDLPLVEPEGSIVSSADQMIR